MRHQTYLQLPAIDHFTQLCLQKILAVGPTFLTWYVPVKVSPSPSPSPSASVLWTDSYHPLPMAIRELDIMEKKPEEYEGSFRSSTSWPMCYSLYYVMGIEWYKEEDTRIYNLGVWKICSEYVHHTPMARALVVQTLFCHCLFPRLSYQSLFC